MSENTIPTDFELPADSNLEMSWLTFAGENHEIYEALVKAWCIQNDISIDEESLSKYFKLHLNRGISYLSGTGVIKSIDDLVSIAAK